MEEKKFKQGFGIVYNEARIRFGFGVSVWDNLRPPKGGLIKLTVYLCKFPKKWRVDNLDSKIQKWSYKPKCNA